jgi:hypothetical protein
MAVFRLPGPGSWSLRTAGFIPRRLFLFWLSGVLLSDFRVARSEIGAPSTTSGNEVVVPNQGAVALSSAMRFFD